MSVISRNIQALRKERGWTQEQLAQALFVTRQTVSNYENGRSKPDLEMLTRIAQVLGAEFDVLLYGLPDREERRRKLGLLAMGLVGCLALLLLSVFLHHLAEPLVYKHYMAAPFLLLRLTLYPWSFLLGGWTLMLAVTLLWSKAPRLPDRIYQRGRRLLIILFFSWWGLLLPTVLYLMAAFICSVMGGTIGFSLDWAWPYTRLMERVVLPIQIKAPWVSGIFGALLCCFHVPAIGMLHERADRFGTELP